MSTEVSTHIKEAVAKGFTYRDEKLLDAWAAGKTPDQIEQDTGIPAAQAVLRVQHLLTTRDVLSDYQQKQLILRKAQKFMAVMDGAVDLVADDHKLAKNYMDALRLVSDLVDKLGTISERELKIITEAQSRAIVGAIERAFYAISNDLRETNPEVDLNRLNAAFRKAVQEGLVPKDDTE